MRSTQPITRADTLIVTVGTRQVGWRCFDGVIRSFGADGNIGYPPHVDELYRELKIERGNYQEKDKTHPWSARDLGKRYYEHCVDWLGGDFSSVELLLDFKIIEAGVQRGLKHIILWGTDQPENVSWSYRRLDTLWLAKLMEGKIKAMCPRVKIDTHTPVIAANDSEAIRQELEILILSDVLNVFSKTGDEQFVLWIQNKGCVPAIAQGVEICAAALVRQCQVFNVSPEEPDSFFELQPNGFQSACPSQKYKLVPMGEHFWPLERERVISAWKRGDFREAQIWLKPHENRYRLLHQLAGYLAIYTNGQLLDFFQKLQNWLTERDLATIADSEQITKWKENILFLQSNEHTQKRDFAKIWEYCFLIDLLLSTGNYTSAFFQFTLTLERLLYIKFKFRNGKSTILGDVSQPDFKELIDAWCQIKKLDENNKWFKLLHRIRMKRNKIVHEAEAATLSQIRSIWTDNGLFPVKMTNDYREISNLMLEVLGKVCEGSWKIPEKPLLRSLYEWGLDVLRIDSTAS